MWTPGTPRAILRIMHPVHDMGGREEHFGPVERDADEPVFHERWEARVFGMAIFGGAVFGANLDAMRHAMERLEPRIYLSSYWRRWLAALEDQLVEQGFLARDELDARIGGSRTASPGRRRGAGWRVALMGRALRLVMRPLPPHVPRALARYLGYGRRSRRTPAFRVGDEVRTRARREQGHTRLPGYASRHRGRIRAVHGPMVFPDAHAHGHGEAPEHLYSVAFDARELWGEGAEPGVVVHVDLFEPYLERA